MTDVTWLNPHFFHGNIAAVGKCPNVSHHPTKKGILHPTDICFGDVKQIPKKRYLPTPVVILYMTNWDSMTFP